MPSIFITNQGLLQVIIIASSTELKGGHLRWTTYAGLRIRMSSTVSTELNRGSVYIEENAVVSSKSDPFQLSRYLEKTPDSVQKNCPPPFQLSQASTLETATKSC